jgi:hypothetical protein
MFPYRCAEQAQSSSLAELLPAYLTGRFKWGPMCFILYCPTVKNAPDGEATPSMVTTIG